MFNTSFRIYPDIPRFDFRMPKSISTTGKLIAAKVFMTLEEILIEMFIALESNDLPTYVKLRPLAIELISHKNLLASEFH